GNDIIDLLLGSNWSGIGELFIILLPWIYLVFIVSPFSKIFLVYKLQKYLMYFNCILLFTRILVLMIGGLYFTFKFTVILLSILGAIVYLTQLIFIFKKLNIKFTEVINLISYVVCVTFFIIIS